ncbi:MAG: hypothetical protein AAGD17_01435 [Bacteroidota bacterium]
MPANIFLRLLLITGFIVSCSSYKNKKQESLLILPELGTVVQMQGDMLYEASEPTSLPSWPILRVEIQQMPFNSSSYTTYAKYKQRAAQINSVPYNDSLPYKPKFLRLTLPDKVKLTQLLNEDGHKALREYLVTDDAYKLVTQLDIAPTENELVNFLNAEAIQLERDNYGSQKLVLVNGEKRRSFFFSELQVFDYAHSTFCWGEDVYHNKKIKSLITDGSRCPKGTFMKPKKMDKVKPYLKL